VKVTLPLASVFPLRKPYGVPLPVPG